jgi:hypothetical protein
MTTIRLRLTLTAATILAYVCAGFGQSETYDFAMSKEFLQMLADSHTVLPILKVHINARTGTVHTLANDCEMHLAGTPAGMTLGDPGSIIVEPPNLCKVKPAGTSGNPSEKKLREKIWPDLFDQKVIGKECEVQGFPRIFTEHASGDVTAANPNHVFEIHPALSIKCGTDEVSFDGFLKAYEGMRHIQPSTATSCLRERKLRVRFKDDQYQFEEEGGTCGNFAIVEVTKVNPDWIRETGGGHTAISRVVADGFVPFSLKLYTLTGSDADKWLASIKANGESTTRTFLLGMFTYDYFQVLKTVRSADGDWLQPSDWTPVSFPLAFVVFGQTATVPWAEE